MNSNSYLIVTPQLIRRGNLRCVGRLVLWLLGASSVFLVLFLFAWMMISIATGWRDLNVLVIIAGFAFAALFFVLGWLHLEKKGPQNWERIAQKSDRAPGMRIGSRGDFSHAQVGEGFMALLLAGPDWLGRAWQEFQHFVSEDRAEELEVLRQNLAAREGWAPLAHFKNHEKEIQQLVSLGLVSVRELVGEWHLHVTLAGQVRRNEDAMEVD